MEALEAGDLAAQGYLALPQRGHGPGVLVLHAWWGLVPTFTEVCDRLAAEGFVAFAPDLYEGRTAATVADAEALMQRSEPAHMRTIALGALAHLRDHPAVRRQALGIIGFSMGVNWALEVTTLQPDAIAALVFFYGVGAMDWSRSRAAVEGHFAEQDDYEPLDGVYDMEATIRAAGREVAFHVYAGTHHWFFEADRADAYDAAAAGLAWERASAFLHRRLDDSGAQDAR